MTHPKTAGDAAYGGGHNKAEPSIAAVVGSLDKECARYATRVSPQGHRLEVIQVAAETLLCAALPHLSLGA